jgi:hypothetical protein
MTKAVEVITSVQRRRRWSRAERDSDRKLKMSDIMDKTICEMRNLGASDKEIAGTLRHAVDVLKARED